MKNMDVNVMKKIMEVKGSGKVFLTEEGKMAIRNLTPFAVVGVGTKNTKKKSFMIIDMNK